MIVTFLCILGLTMLWMAVLLGGWYYYRNREESKISYNKSSINEDNDSSSSPLLKGNTTNYNTIEESKV